MRQEAAVTFSTGFQVNLGAISCLVGKGDTVYLDKQDHACIIDGARLSFGDVKKFKHNDPADLRRQMRNDGEAKGRLVVVDGVFSMEGDIAPLPEIVAVAREFAAGVMVDDAHGIGVLGQTGRGTAEHFGLEDEVDLIMGTFSKSMASVGGFIAGNADGHRLHQAPRAHADLLGGPAAGLGGRGARDRRDHGPGAGAARAALGEHPLLRRGAALARLRHRRVRRRRSFPIVVGEDLTALRMVHRLQEEGVFVNCVLSPATPPGRALIRTSLMATHPRDSSSRALEAFEKVGREVGLVRVAAV